MSDEAYQWALYLATLLHDVPWKPWIVTGRLKGWEGLEGKVNREGCRYSRIIKADERNDREAQAFIAWLACRLEELGARDAVRYLVEVVEKDWRGSIHEADMLASSVDRILSPPLKPTAVRNIRLINMFNPTLARANELLRYANKLSEIIEVFLSKLSDLIKEIVTSCKAYDPICILKRLYMTLYSLLEIEWYRASQEVVGTPLSPVSDTRIPHHTVFDHTRASVTALAMRDKTVYAIIDVPGVHNFISLARKTRDFWAGSWIISAVVWGAIRDVIEDEGPHVILLPALQLNPFYLDMLVSKVPSIGDKFPEIAWKMLGEWPSQPLMPATVSLVLDGNKWSCNKLQDEIEKSFQDSWNRLWSILSEELKKVKSELEESTDLHDWCNPYKWDALELRDTKDVVESIKRLLCIHAMVATKGKLEDSKKLLMPLIDYLIEATKKPPLGIKLACVEVDYSKEDYRSFVEELLSKLRSVRFGKENVRNAKTIDELIKEVVHEVSGRKLMAKEILDRVLRFLYLLLKAEEEIKNIPNVTPSYTVNMYSKVKELWRHARTTPHPHSAYRYCSVCGKLPAAIRAPRLGEEVQTPWGSIVIARNVVTTSSTGSWNLRSLERLLGYLVDEGEALCPYCLLKRVLARFPAIVKGLITSARNAERGDLASTLRVANNWLEEDITEQLGRELSIEIKEVRMLYDTSPDRLLDLLRGLGKLPRHYRRIAIIYGDGDMMGKGYIRGALVSAEVEWPKATQVLKSLLMRFRGIYDVYNAVSIVGNRVFKEDMIPVLLYYYNLFSRVHGVIDDRVIVALATLVTATTKILRDKGLLKESEWPLTVIPTLSYMRTLSTGLMVSALVDALIVKALKGVLVYAGGDDVLAIMPSGTPHPSNLIKSVMESFKRISVRGRINYLDSLIKRIVSTKTEATDVSVVLITLALTRLNYWGLLSSESGFHVYDGVVAQATVAHGRSYGVNFVHFRTPLWISFNDACRLMEMKDEVLIRLMGGVRGVRKDVAIIGFEGGEESVIPLSLLTLTDRIGGMDSGGDVMEYAIKGLKQALKIYDRVADRTYSISIFYDVVEGVSRKLLQRLISNPNYLNKVLLEIVARNRRGSVDDVDRELVRELSQVVVGLRELEGSGRVKEELPLFLHILRSLKHCASSARRG